MPGNQPKSFPGDGQPGRYQSLAGREVMLNTEPLAATLAHPNCGDYKFGWLQSFQKPLKRFFGCGGQI